MADLRHLVFTPSGFVTVKNRVMPASCRSDSLDLTRPPSVRLVFVDWRASRQHWINNAPCFLDIIFTSEQGGVTQHRVPEHSFVRIHFLGAGMAGRQLLR